MKNEVTIVRVQKLLGLFVVTYRLQGEDFNRVSNRQTMEEVNKTIQESGFRGLQISLPDPS